MDYSRLFNLLRCLCLFVSVLLSPTQSYSVSLSICHVALWFFSFFVSHYLVVSVFICLSVILRLSLPLCHSSPFSVFSSVSLVICLSVSAFLFLSLQFNRLLVLKSTQHTHTQNWFSVFAYYRVCTQFDKIDFVFAYMF